MRKGWAAMAWLLCAAAQAQYNNAWIDYNQVYLRVPIAADGIYRIPAQHFDLALQAAGVAGGAASIDAQTIRCFARGAEVALYLEGESDGVLNGTDFIEFYGRKNDGWLDERFYPSAADHTNPFYSLYSDTIAYFFTWGAAVGQRLTAVPFTSAAATSATFVLVDQVKHFGAESGTGSIYHRGPNLGDSKAITGYVAGKGWVSSFFGYASGSASTAGGLKSHTFSTTAASTAANAPQPTLEAALVGYNMGANSPSVNDDHHVKLTVAGAQPEAVVADVLFDSYDYVRQSVALTSTSLGTSTTVVRARTEKTGALVNANTDYNCLAYLRLRYARSNNLSGAAPRWKFIAPAAAVETYLNGTNWSTAATSIAYDLVLNRRLEVNHTTGQSSLGINLAAGNEREFFVCTDDAITTVAAAAIEAVNGTGRFRNLSQPSGDSLYVVVAAAQWMNQCRDYAAYRALSHDTLVVSATELRDQFAFGVPHHPEAIRGFMKMAAETWNTPPAHLFLMGKAVQENEHRPSTASAARAADLVPTMGYPPTDNLLTAGLGTAPHTQAIATGRLAATTAQEISAYKSKVVEYETAQGLSNPYQLSRLWQKRALHFAGGTTLTENILFRQYLGGYESYFEQPQMGGKVFTFSKTSDNPIEQIDLDTLNQLLSEGASIMTFFGHAASNSFDISVDDPTEWNNPGRYPLVLANSCYTGNMHRYTAGVKGIAESYVLTAGEGAIGFVATPDLSYPDHLNNYTSNLYQNLAVGRYGQTVGEQMAAAAATITTGAGSSNDDLKRIGVALEMSLHGDPALRINPHALPELSINDPAAGVAIGTAPASITTALDSFDVQVRVSNLGRATTETVSVTVRQTSPDGTLLAQKAVALSGVNYADTAVLRLPTAGVAGNHLLHVEVDLPVSAVSEFDDAVNNTAEFMVPIAAAEIEPVYPYNFAVVPSFNQTLKANTPVAFNPQQTYVIEFDTNDGYASALARQHKVSQAGAIVGWRPGFETMGLADSTVIFWRVWPEAAPTKVKEFSFQVINGQHGWGQAHFHQFKNNRFDFIDYDRTTRQMPFVEATRELKVVIQGNSVNGTHELNSFRLDGLSGEFGEYGVEPGGQAAMAIAVIDTTELKPWGTYGYENGTFFNADHQFGNSNNYLDDPADNRARVERWFTFEVGDAAQMDSMASMITTAVPDGYYLLAVSLIRADFQGGAWAEMHRAAFESLGADSIRYVPTDHPYIFFVKKGSPETAVEVVGKQPTEKIELQTTLSSNVRGGSIEGPMAGPANHWHTMHLSSKSDEAPTTDSLLVMALNGSTELVEARLSANGSTAIGQSNLADTALFLRMEATDETNGTARQLRSWHMLYSPVPDAAANPAAGDTWSGDKLSAGAPIKFGVAVENISAYGFDSLRVHYSLLNDGRETVAEQWLAYDTLAAEQVVNDAVEFDTRGLSGRYTLRMEINPLGEGHQREHYAFNNVAERSLTVVPDQTNPLLNVTFDGVHILNGDIVSPVPEIFIELWDENTALPVTDTAAFSVFITYPNGDQNRIPFQRGGTQVMQFEPATSSSKKASVTYAPPRFADGMHTLTVRATDASGNAAGKTDLNLDFEVVNASSITQVMNYPNPFTTSTRFAFTLTGTTVPEVFTIQILTMAGRVVREITRDELGTIHIGRNLSAYAWNGTDEFGDRLANGVYLYRVITKIDGEAVEQRASGADAYFKQGFGKMYLFR